MTEGAPLLELRGVSKVFGAVQALNKVNLAVPAGKVTALVGDNGAGKSVTIKTISGLWQPTEGQILWEGQAGPYPQPERRRGTGITTIYQDLALCDNLDIVQNLFLGHEMMRHRLPRRDRHGADRPADARRTSTSRPCAPSASRWPRCPAASVNP